MGVVIENYVALTERIAAAAEAAGRDPRSVKLLAVSKGQDAPAMQLLAGHLIALGQEPLFGESYVQEYRKKRPVLPVHRCHMIGRLQRNKVREAVSLFDVIESVSSEDLAEALNREAQKQNKLQKIFLQVNISGDAAKNGFQPEAVMAFAQGRLRELRSLACCGVMTITRYYDDSEGPRLDFRALRELAERMKESAAGFLPPDFEISMGMSSDFGTAIQEGATLVRVGTGLFGERPDPSP